VSDRRQGLYRIDDVLLRAGGVVMLGVLLALGVVFLIGLATGTGQGAEPGWEALARVAPQLVLAGLCPVALLGTGYAIRRRDQRTVAVWNLLRKNAEIHVPALLAHSDFARRDLDRAIRVLNNRGLGHYVWDRKSDKIQDGRLRSLQIHVEACDVCGAAVSLEIPIAFSEIPRCPYCHDPVAVETLEKRRREAIDALREEHRDESRRSRVSPGAETSVCAPAAERPFSLPLFLVLLFCFWPAAVLYAWIKG
jgi:hypothetical protein